MVAAHQVAAVRQRVEAKGREEEKAGVGLAEGWAEGTVVVVQVVLMVASMVVAEAAVAVVAVGVVPVAAAAQGVLEGVRMAVAAVRASPMKV